MVSAMTSEEALARLGPQERAWVEEFRDRVRDLLGPRLRDLRLFGSRARGDFHEESDVDVLVLVQDLDRPTRLAVWDVASSISSWLSPLVGDFDRYHSPRSRATGLYQEIRRESVRL